MNTNIDVVTPEGPVIEASVILEFLSKRFTEVLASGSPKVPFLLQGLGFVGLTGQEELIKDYKGLLGSSILPPPEIIRRSVEIFHLALERDADGRSDMNPIKQSEEDYEPDEKYGKQIIMNALRESKIMIEQSDYRFVQVFVVLGWGGLQFDKERLAEFEAVLQSFADDPENLLKRGSEILRDAIFRPGRRLRICINPESI
jgi:hypothetical protein